MRAVRVAEMTPVTTERTVGPGLRPGRRRRRRHRPGDGRVVWRRGISLAVVGRGSNPRFRRSQDGGAVPWVLGRLGGSACALSGGSLTLTLAELRDALALVPEQYDNLDVAFEDHGDPLIIGTIEVVHDGAWKDHLITVTLGDGPPPNVCCGALPGNLTNLGVVYYAAVEALLTAAASQPDSSRTHPFGAIHDRHREIRERHRASAAPAADLHTRMPMGDGHERRGGAPIGPPPSGDDRPHRGPRPQRRRYARRHTEELSPDVAALLRLGDDPRHDTVRFTDSPGRRRRPRERPARAKARPVPPAGAQHEHCVFELGWPTMSPSSTVSRWRAVTRASAPATRARGVWASTVIRSIEGEHPSIAEMLRSLRQVSSRSESTSSHIPRSRDV